MYIDNQTRQSRKFLDVTKSSYALKETLTCLKRHVLNRPCTSDSSQMRGVEAAEHVGTVGLHTNQHLRVKILLDSYNIGKFLKDNHQTTIKSKLLLFFPTNLQMFPPPLMCTPVQCPSLYPIGHRSYRARVCMVKSDPIGAYYHSGVKLFLKQYSYAYTPVFSRDVHSIFRTLE